MFTKEKIINVIIYAGLFIAGIGLGSTVNNQTDKETLKINDNNERIQGMLLRVELIHYQLDRIRDEVDILKTTTKKNK